MQHKAMSLMSKKMAAAQALEGEFSADGLAAMAGDDNLTMALAKNLSEGIDDSDVQRNWEKIKSGPKKRKQGDALVAAGKKIAPNKMDDLPIEVQMITESMIENQDKPPPAGAEGDYEDLATRLRLLDEGFDALPDGAEEDDRSVLPDEPEPVKPLVLKLRPVPTPDPEPEPCDFDDDVVAAKKCPRPFQPGSLATGARRTGPPSMR
jgi:hypothetical protein